MEGSEDKDEEVKEVQAIEMASVMNEDDKCSEYQLQKHHRCACHLLNLISTAKSSQKLIQMTPTRKSVVQLCQVLGILE